jgi:hypothetical protein
MYSMQGVTYRRMCWWLLHLCVVVGRQCKARTTFA